MKARTLVHRLLRLIECGLVDSSPRNITKGRLRARFNFRYTYIYTLDVNRQLVVCVSDQSNILCLFCITICCIIREHTRCFVNRKLKKMNALSKIIWLTTIFTTSCRTLTPESQLCSWVQPLLSSAGPWGREWGTKMTITMLASKFHSYTCTSTPHLPVTVVQLLRPKCTLCSGWLCMTSRPALFYSGRCGSLIVRAWPVICPDQGGAGSFVPRHIPLQVRACSLVPRPRPAFHRY